MYGHRSAVPSSGIGFSAFCINDTVKLFESITPLCHHQNGRMLLKLEVLPNKSDINSTLLQCLEPTGENRAVLKICSGIVSFPANKEQFLNQLAHVILS